MPTFAHFAYGPQPSPIRLDSQVRPPSARKLRELKEALRSPELGEPVFDPTTGRLLGYTRIAAETLKQRQDMLLGQAMGATAQQLGLTLNPLSHVFLRPEQVEQLVKFRQGAGQSVLAPQGIPSASLESAAGTSAFLPAVTPLEGAPKGNGGLLKGLPAVPLLLVAGLVVLLLVFRR